MSGDSVGKVVAEMHAINDSPELCALYDRLESLDRQHREEAARHEAFASQAVLDMRRKDGLIEAAEAALGEALTLLRDIQADRSWRSNDNTLWPRIVAITRTSKEASRG